MNYCEGVKPFFSERQILEVKNAEICRMSYSEGEAAGLVNRTIKCCVKKTIITVE